MGDVNKTKNIIVIFSLGLFFLGFLSAQNVYAQSLFVSAENPRFNNYMAGPQVIEIIIIDSDISETSKIQNEPVVKVNGKEVRMVQAVDGNWYAYFADLFITNLADFTATTTGSSGQGLDFGVFCGRFSGDTLLSDPNFKNIISISDTRGIWLQDPGDVTGFVQGNSDPSSFFADSVVCSNTANDSFETDDMNVIREQTAINEDKGPPTGQIGLDSDFWPFIQLYALNPTGNIVVQYEKDEVIQRTTLTFDEVDQFVSTEFVRQSYFPGDDILVSIEDIQLNIDPTDEDSWTFGTQVGSATFSTNYQVFDENGNQAGDGKQGGTINIQPFLTKFMFGDNGIFIIDVDPLKLGIDAFTLQDNDDSVLELDFANTSADSQVIKDWTTKGFNDGVNLALGPGSWPITFTENGSHSGFFESFDQSNISNLRLTNNAIASSFPIIDYNMIPQEIIVEQEPPLEPKKSCNALEKVNPAEQKGKAKGKEIAKEKNNCN